MRSRSNIQSVGTKPSQDKLYDQVVDAIRRASTLEKLNDVMTEIKKTSLDRKDELLRMANDKFDKLKHEVYDEKQEKKKERDDKAIKDQQNYGHTAEWVEQQYEDIRAKAQTDSEPEIVALAQMVAEKYKDNKELRDDLLQLIEAEASKRGVVIGPAPASGEYIFNSAKFVFNDGVLVSVNGVGVNFNMVFKKENDIIYIEDNGRLEMFSSSSAVSTIIDSINQAQHDILPKKDERTKPEGRPMRDMVGQDGRHIKATEPVYTGPADVTHIYQTNYTPYNLIEKAGPILLLGTGATLFFLILMKMSDKYKEEEKE